MRLSLFTARFLILTFHLIIPVILIVWTWRHKSVSRLGWIVKTLVGLSYFIFIYIAGSWVFMSFYLRYLLPLLYIVAWTASYKKIPYRPGSSGGSGRSAMVGNAGGIIVALALLFMTMGAAGSYVYEEKPVNLAFPFKNGVYAVFEGGNGRTSGWMNHHFSGVPRQGAGANRSMKYAVDITKLNMLGNDAWGILPRQNEKYAVFNEPVYSPCDGEVFSIDDQWPDETPGGNEAPYNVGNHVAVRSGDRLVLMGNLRKGSIKVKKGDLVKTGQLLAQVGNSGRTSQPHLHIQAMKVAQGSMWEGEGIPLFFDGMNTFKNAFFFKN